MQQKKAFAFKVAQQVERKTEQKTEQWKAREGVAVAGCTVGRFDLQWGTSRGRDNGDFC